MSFDIALNPNVALRFLQRTNLGNVLRELGELSVAQNG
jgi:hypothetical protein